MYLSPIKQFPVLILVFFLSLDLYGNPFPDTSTPGVFKAETRTLSRAHNLPNMHAGDDYLGLKLSSSILDDQQDDRHGILAARAVLYPNTGYHVWVQLSQWPGETPHFGVSTGVQVEYPGENPRFRKAIGVGWTEVYASIHKQRDIQIYGLLGRSTERFEIGIASGLTLHHVIVDDGHSIPDYDETFVRFMPYIGMMITKGHFAQIVIPFDNKGVILNLSWEMQLGARE